MKNQAGVKLENQAVIYRFRWHSSAAATLYITIQNNLMLPDWEVEICYCFVMENSSEENKSATIFWTKKFDLGWRQFSWKNQNCLVWKPIIYLKDSYIQDFSYSISSHFLRNWHVWVWGLIFLVKAWKYFLDQIWLVALLELCVKWIN